MIPYSTQSIHPDDIAAVSKVLGSSHLTQGGKVDAFETALAEYVGVKHAIVFNAATSALHGAYAVAGIGEGDEVITSPISFVATSNMLIAQGATPVFCDVKLDGNLDASRIEALITPKTKAIVPVDFGGKPAALEAMRTVAQQHDLLLIEDACHALGSAIDRKKVGSFADMTIFSFHAIKPITTGEGGAVLTDNDTYAEQLRLFRSHGMVKKQFWNSDMVTMGYNFRMTDIAAALGLSQLKKLEGFIARRNEIAAYYDERFKGHKLFTTIPIDEGTYSARHLYPILLMPALYCPKEDIFAALLEKGIGVQVHYKPIYQNSFYKARFGEQSLPVANDFYKAELSIPCHQNMSMQEVVFVADTLLEVLDHYRMQGCDY